MTLIRDYVVQSAKQAGIPEDDPALKEFTDNKDSLELSEDLAKKINSSFLTMEAAKNHSDLISHFKSVNLNGVDARLQRQIEDSGLTPEQIGTLKNQENTFERITDFNGMVKANAVQALTDYKASNAKPEHKEEMEKLTKEIERLNGEIKTSGEGSTEDMDNLKKAHDVALLEIKVNTLLAGYNYANKDVDIDGNIAMTNALLFKGLATDGLKIGEKEGVPTLEKVDGSDHFVDNAKVSLRDYMDKILSNNKLLAASPPTPGTPPIPGTPVIAPTVNNEKAKKSLDDYLAAQQQT